MSKSINVFGNEFNNLEMFLKNYNIPAGAFNKLMNDGFEPEEIVKIIHSNDNFRNHEEPKVINRHATGKRHPIISSRRQLLEDNIIKPYLLQYYSENKAREIIKTMRRKKVQYYYENKYYKTDVDLTNAFNINIDGFRNKLKRWRSIDIAISPLSNKELIKTYLFEVNNNFYFEYKCPECPLEGIFDIKEINMHIRGHV